MSGAALGLQAFASKLIAASCKAGVLDDNEIRLIKLATIEDAKRCEVFGFPVESDAEILGNSLKLIEYFIDGAIASGSIE